MMKNWGIYHTYLYQKLNTRYKPILRRVTRSPLLVPNSGQNGDKWFHSGNCTQSENKWKKFVLTN